MNETRDVRYVTAGIHNGRYDSKTADQTPIVGSWIFCDGELAEVTAINDYAAGEHNGSPIKNTWRAREFVTARGSRWVGYTS